MPLLIARETQARSFAKIPEKSGSDCARVTLLGLFHMSAILCLKKPKTVLVLKFIESEILRLEHHPDKKVSQGSGFGGLLFPSSA